LWRETPTNLKLVAARGIVAAWRRILVIHFNKQIIFLRMVPPGRFL
jgi:hypothetical protein